MRRFDEIDFARALPLLGLPFVHVLEESLAWGYLDGGMDTFTNVFLFLCAFGPSIFMTVLGMNIAFSSHTSAPELARRGVKTFFISCGLNIVRFLIPGAIVTLVTGEIFYLSDAFWSCLWSDILFFAAFAFLFFALMKKIKVSPYHIILIALVILGIHMLIAPAENMSSNNLTELIGNFVHVTENSAFPLLAWLTYPAVGYAAGLYMKKCPDERALRSFYNKIFLGGIVGLFVSSVCMMNYGLSPHIIAAAPANHNITDLFNIILDMSIAGIWFGIMYYFYGWIKKTASPKVLGFITDLSKAIMIFYIIQWIIIGGLEYYLCPFFEESHAFGYAEVLISGFVIMVVSIMIALPVKRWLDQRKVSKKQLVIEGQN